MTTVNEKIFKAYDIRGIYPTDVNEEALVEITRAIYSFFAKSLGKRKYTIVLGHDMRLSSPSLHTTAKETLVKCGATVIDIGLSSTPSTYFATLSGQYDTGIQITASHNPKEYAGVKFLRRDGDKLIKIGKNTGMNDIKQMVLDKNFEEYTNDGEVIVQENTIHTELEKMVEFVNPRNIKDLKVVADTASGMGAVYLDAIFKRFPLELVRMNFELDGSFPVHEANPALPENIADLKKRVVEEKADIGITTDGDGDRVMFINEKGELIDPTLITSLIVNEVLKKSPKERFIVDIRYIWNVQNICKKVGAPVSVSRVGHAFITEQLNNEGAFFAGESSGHYFFKFTGGAEASIAVILYVLEVLAREKKPISQITKELSSSYESGEFNFELAEGTVVADLLASIENDYKDGTISKLDGIAIDFPDWRFGIRTSNTEPLLRLNVEGPEEALVKEKLHDLTEKILASGAKSKSGH